MKKLLLTSLLVVLLILAAVFLLPAAMFRIAVSHSDVTDPAKYEKTLKKLHYSTNEEIAHFPAEIPEGAADVRFQYTAGALQGGSVLMLSYTVKADEIPLLRAKLAEAAAASQEPVESLPDEGLYRGNLPEDFPVEEAEAFVFRANPYLIGSWNHGQYSLALLAEETGQIVYLWERW